jgi:GntR family transcriptional regulator, transcriptional repressor for pyruvate dehydrogenase complex
VPRSVSTQVEQVARRIESTLLGGNARGDSRLPSERALADRFAVSRATVREAIASLVSRGLLTRRQGDGTYVVSPADRGMAEIWGDMAQQYPMLQGDLVEFRVMLERQTAHLAALRHDANDRERLQATYADVDAAYAGNDRAQQIRSDVAFHRAIADATHNPVFSYLMSSLLKLLHEHVQLSLAGLEPHSDTAQQLRVQHRRLLDAILTRDATRARSYAGEHMDFVAVRLNSLGKRATAD